MLTLMSDIDTVTGTDDYCACRLICRIFSLFRCAYITRLFIRHAAIPDRFIAQMLLRYFRYYADIAG